MKLISIYNSDKKATKMVSTSTGSIAKIDGKWYSINGNEHEILDMRHALSSKELAIYQVNND